MKWTAINLVAALVFTTCCILAHKYMVRPTLSVTIWPAAGIGVGLIMVWGRKIIPAIMLGELINSFVLYQVHVDFGWNKTTFYDFLLYLNNVFRPLFAGFLARRMMGPHPRLIQFRKISRFFLYACVLPCLLTTTVFAILLTAAGHYNTGDYFTKGFLWYSGDLLSVMIFTPIVMSLLARPRTIWQPRIITVALPSLGGFLLVFMLFNSFKNYEEQRINEIIRTHQNYLVNVVISDEMDAGELQSYLQQEQDLLNLDSYKTELEVWQDGAFRQLYLSQDVVTTRYENHVIRREFDMTGQRHRLTMTPTNQFFAEEGSSGLWLSLFIALTFAGFASVGMLTLTGRHVLTAREVTERTLQLNLINKELQARNLDYQRIIDTQPVIFWKVNLGLDQVTFVSQEAEAILGYSVNQWLSEPHFFTRKIHPNDLSMVKDAMLQEHDQEANIEIEYRLRHADGQYRWFRDVLHIPEDFSDSREVMGMLVDITDKKNDTEKIHHLAFHDYLTQLPNRQKFQSELKALLKKSQQHKTYGAVLFLDMDRFKVLNDALGHHFGDQLLLNIASRLETFEAEFKVIARFGGDEFVMATDCEYSNANDAGVQIIILAEQIIDQLAEPYDINGHHHICTVSMGIAIYPFQDVTVNDVIRQADVAMYRSKEQGRNQVTMYHESMKKDNDKMLFVEQVLRNAVNHDHFILKYQPIVDGDRQVVAFESLIRIFSEQETLFPDEFIPVAEDTDLIQSVGRWVISHACLKIMDCQYNISVNVSSKQFHQQGFIMYIDQMMKRFNIGKNNLVIELTEGVVVGSFNEIQYKFNRLKEMGVMIAIDDFGTGYSSLEYLRQLPIDYLKIDKSFVFDLDKDNSSRVIIETIISMAKHLNLQTVAEGVETEQQFSILKDIGCDYFQGYLFGKPGDLLTLS
ncbi:bifunctional diguanylate cyclase/phosphodiesterase [Marinicella sediminis]|uniref:bifunctional diguanylate cyclase/phosphodiesterase n=1 Tax=Marinicella sediminis TaxID=1792834 RepID=UPI0018E3CB28|nr:EAL domain-containing protein [Marinicella sediminis]